MNKNFHSLKKKKKKKKKHIYRPFKSIKFEIVSQILNLRKKLKGKTIGLSKKDHLKKRKKSQQSINGRYVEKESVMSKEREVNIR
jgi:hypothetical protein